MSKVNVRRRGPANTDRSVTLRSLRPGETFRFRGSQPGTVYQMLEASDRWASESGLDTGKLRFVYSNIATGRIFGDVSNHEVVLVDCTVTARERLRTEQRASSRLRMAETRRAQRSR